MSRDSWSRELALQERWRAGQHTNEKWQIIRDAYSLKLPSILQQGRCSPYFLDWWHVFTPIEHLAWQDIRGSGLQLYPQFPVGRFFIDFADPIRRIGVELDGAAYHEERRDTLRDMELWEQGWRIFRIPGRNSLAAPEYPWEATNWHGMSETERVVAYCEWGSRWSEGFFHALGLMYYGKRTGYPEFRRVASWVLDQHRYIEFPIDLDGEDE